MSFCFSCSNNTEPPKVKINQSGIAYHYYSKGWLVNTPSRKVVLTCTHSNPSAGISLNFKSQDGEDIERTVSKVFKVSASVNEGQPLEEKRSGDIFHHFFESDATLLVLNEPVPLNIKAYDFAGNFEDEEWIFVVNQEGKIITGKLDLSKGTSVASIKNGSKGLIGGDSGLPWFNRKGKVLSHSTGGHKGYGSLYSHKLIKSELFGVLSQAEKYAQENLAPLSD